MNPQKTDQNPFAFLTEGLAALPDLVEKLGRIEEKFAHLEAEVKKNVGGEKDLDGWIDAAKAAKYLDMSPGTFDKYRYTVEPKITGHTVGGKTLYKRTDLDLWVKLWELKSNGLA